MSSRVDMAQRTKGMNASFTRVPIVVGTGLLLITAYAYRPHRADPDDVYVTENIDRGPIQSTVTATGIVNPVNIVQVGTRSEEHTSELQSRSDLVCRLLLEKKKMTNLSLSDDAREPFDMSSSCA